MNQTLTDRFLAAKRRLFDKVYGRRLNECQRQAVFYAHGPLLVLAGAGSGKTTVLTNRIEYLIRYGNGYHATTVPDGISVGMVEALEAAYDLDAEEILGILPEFISEPCPPWAMLAITFTNKAAREILERLEQTFGDTNVTNAVWTGTFHSVCLRILRKFGDRLGYRSGFSIHDTDDKRRMIEKCMKDLGISDKYLAPKTVANLISAAKDRLLDPDGFDIDADPRGRDVQRIYEYYQQQLMNYNAVDFDDIIMQTVRLLQTDEEVLRYYQNKFEYVCVDEYQDTNYAQFVLTSLLSGKHNNLMVVGDDDQSIYKFRGATVENILDFSKTYPNANVVKLEQNYRSTETILKAANAVISHNDHRHGKNLWSEAGEGDRIVHHRAQSDLDEGRFIVESIIRGVRLGGRKYSDFAVLYRVNQMGRSLEGAFSKSGIPYRILGAQRFADRKEIRDMLAYLYLVDGSTDDLRLKRIINEPKRKIGTATVEAIERIAEMNGLSMLAVVENAAAYPDLSSAAAKLRGFAELIAQLRALSMPPSALIAEVFDRSGYRAMLEADGPEGELRIEYAEELVSAAIEYEKRCEEIEQEPTLTGFLEEMALVSDVDRYAEDADAVVLMTVHTAKGLEFPVVFLAGMEDGIFPTQQSMSEPDGISEERRLAYVAITRAKQQLYITTAKERRLYGRTLAFPISQFTREIPRELLQETEPRPEPRRPTSRGTPPMPTVSRTDAQKQVYDELHRPAAIGRHNDAATYGVERCEVGTRVRHAIFGDGVIESARDMGGDILYVVRFDNGETKRLMATFAKLKKI